MKNSNIILGMNFKKEKNVIIGVENDMNKKMNVIIGSESKIRSFTIIYKGVNTGKNFQTGHGVLIRENNTIGDNVSIGTNSELAPGNTIGDNVRIHSNCFLESCKIGNNVFIGPSVVFTDDLHPICPRYKECVGGAKVEDNVSIGANSTILPGVKIGKWSLVGGGSVVTKDVPPNSVIAGNPAKILKSTKELKCIKKFYERPYEWRK